MSNYYILTVAEQTGEDRKYTAEEVFNKRMEDKFWGLSENNMRGEKLKAGDKILFYLGDPFKEFAGMAELDSRVFTLTEEDKAKYNIEGTPYNANVGVKLKNIVIWNKDERVEIEEIIDKLNFIKNKNKWWTHLQGGIVPINKDDYRIIEKEFLYKKALNMLQERKRIFEEKGILEERYIQIEKFLPFIQNVLKQMFYRKNFTKEDFRHILVICNVKGREKTILETLRNQFGEDSDIIKEFLNIKDVRGYTTLPSFPLKEENDTKIKKLRNILRDIIEINSKDLLLKKFDEIMLLNINGLNLGIITPILYYIKPAFFPIYNSRVKWFYDKVLKAKDYKEVIEMTHRLAKDINVQDLGVIDALLWGGPDGITEEGNDITDFKEDKDMKEIKDNIPLNRIFYGPPGTGKTYKTIEEAVKICNPEFYNQNKGNRGKIKEEYNRLASEGRIAFVTFHQSYGYEEFVEGIKPVNRDGEITYEVKSGIFKKVCMEASRSQGSIDIDLENVNFYKMAVAEKRDKKSIQYCLDNNVLALGYGEDIDFSLAETKEDIERLYKENGIEPTTADIFEIDIFINRMKKGDIVFVSYGAYNIVGIALVEDEYFCDPDAPIEHHQFRKVTYLWKAKDYEKDLKITDVLNKDSFHMLTLYSLKKEDVKLDELYKLLKVNRQSYKNIDVDEILEKIKEYIKNEIEEKGYCEIKGTGERRKDWRIYEIVENGLVFKTKNGEGGYRKLSFDLIKKDIEFYIKGKIKDPKDIKSYRKENSPRGNDVYYFDFYKKMEEVGILKLNNINQNYVLIIDEINRGNISKIFGELITLIEEDKRIGKPEELKVTLPYSNEKFGVPSNLYIIGTMNTADRSIALIDTALRRRFVFEEMMPDPDLIRDIEIEGISLGDLLEHINDTIEIEYDRDHTIGHSYFMRVKDIYDLRDVFKYRIIPLLQEYFYDDWEKIRNVLGSGFIEKKKIGDDRYKYELKKDVLEDNNIDMFIDALKSIVNNKEAEEDEE